jgi:protein-disulfide isomerase
MSPTISDRLRFPGIWMAIVWAGLAMALLLSLSLAVGLCTDACKATYEWTIFGMKFPFFGIGFFAFCLLLFHFRDRSVVRGLFPAVIAAAWGAEFTFLYVQHSLIKKWCPFCLAVALCVWLAGIALAADHFYDRKKKPGSGRGVTMRSLSRGIILAVLMAAGSYVAYVGLGNPTSSHAESLPVALGKIDSDVEVFVFTDWFCPACRKAEPEMERAYPNIMSRAKLVFVDMPIHAESMNFIPYNLSFLVREKGRYLEIRKALHRLAQRTKEPTPEDVQKAVAPLGVTYRPLNYADVNAGVQYFQSVAKVFEINSTPTMVIYNRKTNSTKVLKGVGDLSYPNILMAVSGVAPP